MIALNHRGLLAAVGYRTTPDVAVPGGAARSILSRLRRTRGQPRLPAGLRIYAIGDIHGRADLLDALLESVRVDSLRRGARETWVILLGDLIDRGPDSDAVVRRAMTPLDWARLRTIKGNHEAALLRALDGDDQMLSIWLANGGVAAALSWGVDVTVLNGGEAAEIGDALRAAVPGEVRSWIERCALSVQVGDYLFVHAGIRPGIPIAEQREDDMLWIREDFLDSRRRHGAVIVHGHSPATEIDLVEGVRIGVDTGAYLTGRLSAVGLEDDRRWFLSVANPTA